MREILFRGKRKDNNNPWIYGHLHKMDGYGTGYTEYGIQVQDIPTSRPWSVLVIPETVGQYTGSTDKNGKKIFEGDVVDFYFFDKGSKNTKTMLIEWRDNGFGMRELYRDYRLADDFSIIKEKIFTYRGDIRNGVYESNNTYFVEVIGNIHDNPELLKGSE